MNIEINPFLINNYLSPEYFCDRENETKTLIENINNRKSFKVVIPAFEMTAPLKLN